MQRGASDTPERGVRRNAGRDPDDPPEGAAERELARVPYERRGLGERRVGRREQLGDAAQARRLS
jgi:hypothetical protein